MIRGMMGLALALLCARAEAQLPKSQLDLQRDSARTLEPASLELRERFTPRTGEPRVLRLRVYASADYRAQTFEWSSRLHRVPRAREPRGGELAEACASRLTDVRRWERAPRPTCRSIGWWPSWKQLDPGNDVDWVMGLAVAVPTLPEQIHNIGMARELGRHFVLRSLHDLAEYEVVRSAFDQMSTVERERLPLAARKQLLQRRRWCSCTSGRAHAQGLIHAQRWQRIMNPNYHHGQSGFSDVEARMIDLGFQRAGGEPAKWQAELARLINEAPDPEVGPARPPITCARCSPPCRQRLREPPRRRPTRATKRWLGSCRRRRSRCATTSSRAPTNC